MSSDSTYLDEILAAKRAELETARPGNLSNAKLEEELAALPPCRDLWAALAEGPKPRIIAEFKRQSPSEGVLREGADPRHIAALYVDAGAAAISVLTDRHFGGSFEDLRAVRSAVSVPILCKDFILSKGQILRARREGADAILLIVAALQPPQLRDLLQFALSLGLEVLAEAHDDREVDRAMAAGARIVGLNARDLHTFEVDLDRVIRHRPDVPRDSGFLYVGESGIKDRKDVQRMRAAGVDGLLIGSTLMRAEDPGVELAKLIVP
ncbi:indole-3-glycerol phosphate synthase TrpC [Pseudenhygromyxa sp. WMMC2535]|uniref:indole-3-glycerol phosphate synthase TrpC n=1 Tax=Pseudenhygromyxa sp. WMMC2535 TaxID=2712867 RepID=UPI00155412B8|nr:indole-3-glycerol phosphate synthase TrpC [Pseudenhygromyxa sp. WMMC2535]NVB42146.1 indole-3-glycerol phosphate synthase TrpC [Pseudenhygromyxa sp. WMMC2535]